MTLLSIKEMVDKTEVTRKDLRSILDKGYYDFNEASLFRSPELPNGLGKEDAHNLRETLRAVPLREFMAKSGTTGIAGAAYLIPDKIHTTLFDATRESDIVEAISIAIITDIPGSSLKVDIGVDGSYKAQDLSSGGKFPDDEIQVTQATITPVLFGISLRIANDMIEDKNWDLIDWHLRAAGHQIGSEASDKALNVLKTGTDGDGTVNTVAAQSDETTILTINSCIRMVAADKWQADTVVGTTEAFYHSTFFPPLNSTYGTYFQAATRQSEAKLAAGPPAIYGTSPLPPLFGCNFIETQSDELYSAITSNFMTNCITVVFDKSQALLTGRKRWLRIENYSDPVRDLVGAVATSRQDSVTVYNDAISVATES